MISDRKIIIMDGTYERVVGSINLTDEIEELLKVGQTFILSATVMFEAVSGERTLVAVKLLPNPVEEVVKYESRSMETYFGVPNISDK